MNIFITILLLIAGIIALLLTIELFTRKKYNIQRKVTIHAPLQKVFDYLTQLKNQDNFNKWVMADPEMKRDFKGMDGTVGFIYAWNGNKKAGEGEQEIKSIEAGKNIKTEVRFVRPFAGVAQVNMMTESISNNQTKVSWSNASEMKYPMNIMVSLIEKMLAKDIDESFVRLKVILEK